MRDDLIRLGNTHPNLRNHIKPILDALTASHKEAKRPQAIGPQEITDALQREFPFLFLTDVEVRDRGNSLLYSAVPDPKTSEITEDGRKQQRTFDATTTRKIKSLSKSLNTFAKKRGYYVALLQIEDWVHRVNAKDVPKRQVAPDASFTQVLWLELQPYYPSDHWTPAKLINKGTPYLYHLTDQEHVSSIKSKGLVPRGSGGNDPKHPFSYPDRTYLFKKRKDVTRALRDFVPTFVGEDLGISLTRTPDVAIIMIDLVGVDPRTKFHEDTSYPSDGAVFTYTHIPPSAITRVIKKSRRP